MFAWCRKERAISIRCICSLSAFPFFRSMRARYSVNNSRIFKERLKSLKLSSQLDLKLFFCREQIFYPNLKLLKKFLNFVFLFLGMQPNIMTKVIHKNNSSIYYGNLNIDYGMKSNEFEWIKSSGFHILRLEIRKGSLRDIKTLLDSQMKSFEDRLVHSQNLAVRLSKTLNRGCPCPECQILGEVISPSKTAGLSEGSLKRYNPSLIVPLGMIFSEVSYFSRQQSEWNSIKT